MSEGYYVPSHVMREWKKRCNCCPDCHQDIPCGGVMSGGFCDNMCDCIDEDEIEQYYIEDEEDFT